MEASISEFSFLRMMTRCQPWVFPLTDNCKRQYPLGTYPLLEQREKWENKGGEGDGRQWEPRDLLPGRGLFADNLSLPFMWFFLFFFFKATATGTMKVNTLQLLLLFFPTSQQILEPRHLWLIITAVLCTLHDSPFPPA